MHAGTPYLLPRFPAHTTTDYIVKIQEDRKGLLGLNRQAQKRLKKMMLHCDALQRMGVQCMISYMAGKEDRIVSSYGTPELLQWLKDISSDHK